MTQRTLPFLALLAAGCGSQSSAPSNSAGDSDSNLGDPTVRNDDPTTTETDCSDGADDDGDGAIDGNDDDCPLAGSVDVAWADAALAAAAPLTVSDVDGDGVSDLVYLVDDGNDGTNYGAVTLSGEAITLPEIPISRDDWALLRDDIDGDGVPDIIRGAAVDGESAFQVYSGPLIKYGDDSPVYSWTWSVGCAVGGFTSIPDVDQDDKTDLAFGSACMDGGIYLLSSEMPTGSEITTDYVAWIKGSGDSKPGYRIETGDLDGDGADELVWLDRGWPDELLGPQGRVYIQDLPVSGIVAADDAATAVLSGTSGHEKLTDFALVGDLTGDGYGDIALAPGMVLEGPLTGTMAVNAIESAAWATIAAPDDNLIRSVQVSGDVDGDGSSEVVFDGCDAASEPVNCGMVYLFTELTAGSNSTDQAGLTVRGADNLAFGASVDTNADGLSELVFLDDWAGVDEFAGFYVFNSR